MKVRFTHPEKIVSLAAGNYQDAVPSPKRKAVGDITFAGQPSPNDTVTINGTVFTFVASGAAGNQINISGVNLSGTIDNAVTVLNASVVAGVAKATYSNVGGTKLRAVHDVYGTVGNAFTIAENGSNSSVAAATLQGGVDPDLIDLTAETMALITPAAVNGATDSEWDLPPGSEGQEVTVYLKTKGTSSNAKINGTFNGGTVLTLDTAGKLAKLKFLGGSWYALANTGSIA